MYVMLPSTAMVNMIGESPSVRRRLKFLATWATREEQYITPETQPSEYPRIFRQPDSIGSAAARSVRPCGAAVPAAGTLAAEPAAAHPTPSISNRAGTAAMLSTPLRRFAS